MNKWFKILFWVITAITAIPAVWYVFAMLTGCAQGMTHEIGLSCCTAIKNFGENLGLSYFAANILVFIIIEPLCVILPSLCCFVNHYTKSAVLKETMLWLVRFCIFFTIAITSCLCLCDPSSLGKQDII